MSSDASPLPKNQVVKAPKPKQAVWQPSNPKNAFRFLVETSRQKFPAEVWLEIFSHLDYITLNHGVRPACRFFHFLLEQGSPAVDKKLFRYPSTVQDLELESGQLHPFLLSYTRKGIGLTYHRAKGIKKPEVVIAGDTLTDGLTCHEKLFLRFINRRHRMDRVWRECVKLPFETGFKLMSSSFCGYKDRWFSLEEQITVGDFVVMLVLGFYHSALFDTRNKWMASNAGGRMEQLKEAVLWISRMLSNKVPKFGSIFEPWRYTEAFIKESGLAKKIKGVRGR